MPPVRSMGEHGPDACLCGRSQRQLLQPLENDRWLGLPNVRLRELGLDVSPQIEGVQFLGGELESGQLLLTIEFRDRPEDALGHGLSGAGIDLHDGVFQSLSDISLGRVLRAFKGQGPLEPLAVFSLGEAYFPGEAAVCPWDFGNATLLIPWSLRFHLVPLSLPVR